MERRLESASYDPIFMVQVLYSRPRMKLRKENAIRYEAQFARNGVQTYTYIFRCKFPGCSREIGVKSNVLKSHRGLCMSHSHVLRPYESIFNRLFHDARGIAVKLTYEEYLEFTSTEACHYCGDQIPWTPYANLNGDYKSRAYFLDRKDHSGPYSKDNCVVCCSFCNRLRGNRFSYDEFRMMALTLGYIRKNRPGRTFLRLQ